MQTLDRTSDPAAATDDAEQDRPGWACITHAPPRRRDDGTEPSWAPAEHGSRVCAGCLARLRARLREVRDRYAVLGLALAPGGTGEAGSRGAPGFGSRPAASPHVVAMRDPRSAGFAVARDDVQYLWDPYSLDGHDPLPEGVAGPQRAGNWTQKRDVWRGRDGRAHTESDRPVRSIPASLMNLADMIGDESGVPAPAPPRPAAPRWPQCRLTWTLGRPYAARIPTAVEHYTGWLDGRLDWVAAQPWVGDVADVLGELLADLRPVTGAPRPKFIGLCRELLPGLDADGMPVPCRAKLYAPPRGDEVCCRGCGARWPRERWLELGAELQAGERTDAA